MNEEEEEEEEDVCQIDGVEKKDKIFFCSPHLLIIEIIIILLCVCHHIYNKILCEDLLRLLIVTERRCVYDLRVRGGASI